MTLPTFLGIGVPKAGTTWLHDLLTQHDDVCMPSRRKELHYLTRHWDRGLEWYEASFPSDTAASAVGEISPHYLYAAEAVERAAEMPSVHRLVLIVRDPVDRAVSHFRHRQRLDGDVGTFIEFLDAVPEATEWGRYATHLQPWLHRFDRSQLLVLVHELSVLDVDGTKLALAEHLEIDPDGFAPGSGESARNASAPPRFPRTHQAGVVTARWLRRHDADGLIHRARRSSAWRRLGDRRGPATGDHEIDPGVLADLRDRLTPEVEGLAAMTGLDLSVWPTSPDHASHR